MLTQFEFIMYVDIKYDINHNHQKDNLLFGFLIIGLLAPIYNHNNHKFEHISTYHNI